MRTQDLGLPTGKTLRKLAFSAAFAGVALLAQAPVSAADYTSTSSATFSDTTPTKGESLTISGKAAPNAVVVVTVAGTGVSRTLGVTTADANGNYSLTVSIPGDLASGIYVLGVTANNQQIASTSVNVAAATTTNASTNTRAATSNLPVTGSSATLVAAGAGVLIAVGGAAVGLSRRRTAAPVES